MFKNILKRHCSFWNYSTNYQHIFRSVWRNACRREVNEAWWRHQMETFSALLALCAGNSPVTGKFPAQRPVTRSFDVFFDLRLNQQLSKQWRRRWFRTLSHSLWRHLMGYALSVSRKISWALETKRIVFYSAAITSKMFDTTGMVGEEYQVSKYHTRAFSHMHDTSWWNYEWAVLSAISY